MQDAEPMQQAGILQPLTPESPVLTSASAPKSISHLPHENQGKGWTKGVPHV